MNRKCYSCTVATKLRFTGVFPVWIHARGGSVSPGVLRSLLGWKLMGTSLLRNWISLINPLQMSVEVHCQSQLVTEILLSHVLTTPGWSCCSVFTLCCREESTELAPKQREAEGPQLVLCPPLTTSAGESFPVSPPCTMQRLPDSSLGIILFPAGSFCCVWAASGGCKSLLPGARCPPCPPTPAVPGRAAGAAFVGGLAGQRPQHP